jgi:hypothetical protein
MALHGTKSWAHSRAYNAFSRAQCLGRQLGETQDLVEVLIGLSASALTRGEVKVSKALAEQMLGLAEINGDRGLISAAQYRVGCALLWGGEFLKAHQHFNLATSYSTRRISGSLLLIAESVLARWRQTALYD